MDPEYYLFESLLLQSHQQQMVEVCVTVRMIDKIVRILQRNGNPDLL